MKEIVLQGGVLERQAARLPKNEGLCWRDLLEAEFQRDLPRYRELDRVLTQRYGTGTVNPGEENLFRAFAACPADKTRVVICGQDPYPNPIHAMGLSFSVPAGAPMPPSLRNILKELEADIGSAGSVGTGDLTPWAEQGVLLLNTALTVEAGEANSHKTLWDGFALNILRELNRRQRRPLVFLLWGKQAEAIGKAMEACEPPCQRAYFYGVHPSPLSAYRGFFGSKPFSAINDFLRDCGDTPIQW